MASVARNARRDDWIDEYLAYLCAEWEAVPALAEDWAGWSEMDRVDFAVDWPIREDRLAQLRVLDVQGRLSLAQQESYRRLVELVALHRPLLDRLFLEAGLPASALDEATRGA